MFYSTEIEKKQLVIKAGILLSEKKLVERTWGNVSVRFDSDYFAISPTGASYYNLKPKDIPVVNLKELTFIGFRKPSSELLLHAYIYRNYPEVSFILHTHQRFASLLSLFFAGQSGSIKVVDRYKNVLGENIPSAEYAEAGTEQIAENVIKISIALNRKALFNCSGIVLMASHGVVCFAQSFDEAFNVVQTLEDFAKVTILDCLKKHGIFLEKNGKLQTYTKETLPTNEENSILNKLCSLIFSEDSSIAFITLSTLPVSQYISKKLDTQLFTYIADFALRCIPAYFDDVAQILGELAIIISNDKDIDSFEKYSKAILEKSNALVLKGIGVLFFSQKEEETVYMTSIFEKNALSFLLSLHDQNIVALTKENASSLHTSFMQGYSKLKNE